MRWDNIKQETDTDFVWKSDNEPVVEDTKLIVFHQNEKGFATFQTGMGIVGSRQPVCSIYSKLFDVAAFNSIPEPAFPEWRMYETCTKAGKRVWVLRLTHVHPMPKNGGADHSWLYTYPVVRDVIKHLSSYGVDELIYMSANQMQASVGYDRNTYIHISPTDLAIMDYNNEDDEALVVDEFGEEYHNDLITVSPAWHFCSLFNSFCGNNNTNLLVYCGLDRKEFVDEQAARTLTRYLQDTHDIWFSYDGKEQVSKVQDLLHDIETLTEARVLDNLQGGFMDEWI